VDADPGSIYASSMLTQAQIASALQRALATDAARAASAEAARAGRIVAVYLFGSVARGQAKATSDVDLGLLYAGPPPHDLLSQPFLLEADLGEQLGCRVQCIVMNDAPVDLVHRILADRSLLIDLDPSFRIAFEVRSRNSYFDLVPFLDRYRRRERAS
jgi:predicted nucleotidyltransferase